MEVFIIFLFMLLFVIGLGVWAWRYEKKRTEALAPVAAELGLQFHTGDNPPFVAPWASYYLFEYGHNKLFANVMHGQVEGVEAAVFDYRFTTGSGKSKSTHHQTVVCLRADDLRLPFFALRPEGIFHKIGQLLGYQDIDFDTHPSFSAKYLLRGQDEAAIRATFDEQLLNFLDNTKGLSLDGGNDRFLYYRHGKRCEPGEVRQMVFDALQVLEHLRAARQA